MKYLISFVKRPGPVPVLAGETVDSLAGECRASALEFINGAGRAWTKRDLALWLAGSYRRAARHAAGGERTADLAGVDEDIVLGEHTIARLMVRVRQDVMDALDEASRGGPAVDFVHECVRRKYVAPRADEFGASLWVPVDLRRMRLLDRVLSLFACDYLMRTDDYVQALASCGRCGVVTFDEMARHTGECGAHRRTSEIVTHGPDEEAETG